MRADLLLKSPTAPEITIDIARLIERPAFQGIRCPLCDWRPSKASLWSCDHTGTPEAPFLSCGTAWNTFSTRGRCPGCSHQWQWTSCHQCGVASPHVAWYDESSTDQR